MTNTLDDQLNIWIVKVSEPCPFLSDERGQRPGRACQLAQFLSNAGHNVTWFNSHFNHVHKDFRNVAAMQAIDLPGTSMKFVFLASSGYKKNISFARFVDHFLLGRSFISASRGLPVPDLVLAHYPVVDLAWRAVQYGTEFGVPVVLDVRDQWPDVIYERMNEKLKRSGLRTDGFLRPYERMAKYAFGKAQAVTAVSTGMLEWAQRRFERPSELHAFDQPFYQTKHYPNYSVPPADSQSLDDFWQSRGVDLGSPKLRFVWAGNIASNTDGLTLLHALQALHEYVHKKIEVVICGLGDLFFEFTKAAETLPFLKVVGWINNAELNYLLDRSHVGLLCYLDRKDFQDSIPNKVVDYTASSIRILSNLGGELARITQDSDILLSYKTGDIDELVSLFNELIEHSDWVSAKSEQSRNLFDSHFSAERVLPEFMEFLLRAAEGDGLNEQ